MQTQKVVIRSGFSPSLQGKKKQLALISHPGAASDLFKCQNDPSPLIDEGCLRRIGGEASAQALCKSHGISFVLEEIDGKLFIHAYRKSNRNLEIVIYK